MGSHLFGFIKWRENGKWKLEGCIGYEGRKLHGFWDWASVSALVMLGIIGLL